MEVCEEERQPLPIGEKVEAIDDDDEVSLILYLGCPQEIQEDPPPLPPPLPPAAPPPPPPPARRELFLRRNVRQGLRPLLVGIDSNGLKRRREDLQEHLQEHQQQQQQRSSAPAAEPPPRQVLKTFERRKKRSRALVLPDNADDPVLTQPSSRKRSVRSKESRLVDPAKMPPAAAPKISRRPPTSGYIYRKAMVIELPILEEPRARHLLSLMGLEKFADEPVPNLDKNLCDEFLSGFDPKLSSGSVRGRVVTVDAAAVAAATGLPLGDGGSAAEIPTGTLSKSQARAVTKAIKCSDEKRTRGYPIKHLAFGGDGDEMQAIATMLMVKLESKSDHLHLVSPEMLLALDSSYRIGIKMRWSEMLARMIARAAAAVDRGKIAFQYGEWLTKIIKNGIGEAAAAAAATAVEDRGLLLPNPEGDRTVDEEQNEASSGIQTTRAEIETLEAFGDGGEKIDEEKIEQVEEEIKASEAFGDGGEKIEEKISEEQVEQEIEPATEIQAESRAPESNTDNANEDRNREDVRRTHQGEAGGGGGGGEKRDAGVQAEEDLVANLRRENRRLKQRYEESMRRETRARLMVLSLKEAYVKFKDELAGKQSVVANNNVEV